MNATQACDLVIEKYRVLVSDGSLSFTDMLSLAQAATATFAKVAAGFAIDMSGPLGRELILAAVGRLYDSVIAPVNITAVPDFLEDIAKARLRQFVLTMVDAWLSALSGIFDRVGAIPVVPERVEEAAGVPGSALRMVAVEFVPYLPAFLSKRA